MSGRCRLRPACHLFCIPRAGGSVSARSGAGGSPVGRRCGRSRSHAGDTLSGREVEILELVAQGLGNRDMARRLFISEATVKTHLVHINTKLGVDTRMAAVRRPYAFA
ncbi:helix-turn-helix domain-containing protein [Prauserella sediminis]|uniref:helix-turn-helix domain-containing protein n=1 Tax=Prauserella sediminis TaxID=577680 RepID=UPI00389A905B